MTEVHEISGRQSRELLKTYTRDLRCELTPDEVRERGEELAQLHAELRDLEAEKKKAMAAFKLRLDDIKRQAAEKAHDVRTHTEERPVECELWADYLREVRSLVRTDTGEEIRVDGLTDDDRQRSMI